MIVDVDVIPTLNRLTINGTLLFTEDTTVNNYTLNAK